MRAHEAHADGVAISKGARVFTVFSTSKDHNQGSQAMCGCILVDFDKLQVINRSPAYRNQYVHRRDSVSLQSLSETEIQKRMRLGLITNDQDQLSASDDDEEERWQDIDDESEEENVTHYRLAPHRRSSVDLMSTLGHESDLGGSNSHMDYSESSHGNKDSLIVDFDTSLRNRSRKPAVSSIYEEAEGFSSSDDMGPFDNTDD
jgi:hypothetical protein